MTPRYVERPSARGAKVAALVYGLVLAAIYLPEVVDGTLRASDLWLIPIIGLVALPFIALSLSKRRYHAITLTDDELVVGRARLPARGLQAHEGDPAPGLPLLGGAYGAPLGWWEVTVEGADGRRWRVATRRPGEFVAAVRGSVLPRP